MEFVVYTDGSYFESRKEVCGGYVIVQDGKAVAAERFKSNNSLFTQSWNVSGELAAVVLMTKKLLPAVGKNRDCTVIINYDYKGVANYLNKGDQAWQAKKQISYWYVESMKELMKEYPNCNLKFNKVKAHSGVYWNEVVDTIAKGNPLPKDIINFEIKTITL